MFGILFKIGQFKYLKELQAGNLYFKPVDYFKQGNNARFDNYENISTYIKKPTGHIDVNGKVTQIDGMIESIGIDNVNNDYTHIWCCSHLISGIAKQFDDNIINDRMREFGDHLLLFTNTQEFFNRYTQSLNQQNIFSHADIIDYKNENQSYNDLCINNKLSSYEWQNEYRIAARLNTVEAVKINIGDLSDISIITELKYLSVTIKNGDLIFDVKKNEK